MNSLNIEEYQEYLDIQEKMNKAAADEANEPVSKRELIRFLQLSGVLKNPKKDIRRFRRYLVAKRKSDEK